MRKWQNDKKAKDITYKKFELYNLEEKAMRKKNAGFTLAELLIVVAIVGILVAISIPMFTAQRKKAIIAVNKANIRSARAAAAAMLYESDESLDEFENQSRTGYRYYIYDVDKGKIVSKAVGENVSIEYNDKGDKKQVNQLGQDYRKIAEECKEKCSKILVFVGNPDAREDAKGTSPIQTAPFYNGNKVGGTANNPFGPKPGWK